MINCHHHLGPPPGYVSTTVVLPLPLLDGLYLWLSLQIHYTICTLWRCKLLAPGTCGDSEILKTCHIISNAAPPILNTNNTYYQEHVTYNHVATCPIIHGAVMCNVIWNTWHQWPISNPHVASCNELSCMPWVIPLMGMTKTCIHIPCSEMVW